MSNTQKTILIVEDDSMVAEICAKHLKVKGYQVVLASNGLEALEKIVTLTPDLILLDLEMPQMNGIEFYHRICNDRGFPKYPVLILTGQTDLENSFREVTVDGFIAKPFSLNLLLSEVENILETQYWRSNNNKNQKIIIADGDSKSLYQIADVFSKASFHVDITEKGIAAMEKIMRNPPAVALINVNLKDITGELVVLRLQRMVKLKNVKFLLFEHQERSEYSTDRTILKYKNPQELLEEVKNITAVESKILHLN